MKSERRHELQQNQLARMVVDGNRDYQTVHERHFGGHPPGRRNYLGDEPLGPVVGRTLRRGLAGLLHGVGIGNAHRNAPTWKRWPKVSPRPMPAIGPCSPPPICTWIPAATLFVDKNEARGDLEKAINDYLKIDATASAPLSTNGLPTGSPGPTNAQGVLGQGGAAIPASGPSVARGTVCHGFQGPGNSPPANAQPGSSTMSSPSSMPSREKPATKLPFDTDP